ncbi:MAG: hypothetical protein ACKOAH_24465 [Pirellula sp.]
MRQAIPFLLQEIPNEGSLQSIKHQMENALRHAQESGNQDLKDAWSKKIRNNGLLQAS